MILLRSGQREGESVSLFQHKQRGIKNHADTQVDLEILGL